MITFAGDQPILDDIIVADGSAQTTVEPPQGPQGPRGAQSAQGAQGARGAQGEQSVQGAAAERCTGTSRSSWSRDAARLFRTTELACEGKPAQRTAGISALEGRDQWLDVQVVFVSGRESVRTRRYVRSEERPAAIANGLPTAQTTAGPAVDVAVADVIEANAVVSGRAVEAWLAESILRVPVNRHALIALSDAEVPANLIDLMVARAYPQKFEVRRSGGGGGGGAFGPLGGFSGIDEFAWMSLWDVTFDPYAFYYSPFMSYRRFIDPMYFSYGGYVTLPVERSGGSFQSSGRARVVNGGGYTRVEPKEPVVTRRSNGDSGYSAGADSASSAGSSSSSSDGGGASASPGGYSAGGGGGQTAVPR